MYIIKGKTITEAYDLLVNNLLNYGRTVNNTIEFTNCIVEIENPNVSDIRFNRRKISDKYLQAELQWYWSGDNSCKTIGSYAKLWLSLSDNGQTSNSAYGYIIQNKFNRDQLQEVIQLLKDDPNSRRAVLNISDPLLHKEKTKDYQCTVAIQFLIRDGKLDETVFMRSNDIIFGFPYDYCFFISVAQFIADELHLALGTYTHHATSMHLYMKDVDKLIYQHDARHSIDMNIIRKIYNTKEKLKEKEHEN